MGSRVRFVTKWQTGYWTMTELGADCQISQNTDYKMHRPLWDQRPAGLHDQSRRPTTARRRRIRVCWTRSSPCGSGIRTGVRRSCWGWRRVASRRRRGRLARQFAIGARPATSSGRGGAESPRCTSRRRWRRLRASTKSGRRISGRISDGRLGVLLSPESTGQTESLGVALRCLGEPHLRGDSAPFRTAFAEHRLP